LLIHIILNKSVSLKRHKKSVVLDSIPLTEVFGVTRNNKISKKSTPEREHLNLPFLLLPIAKFSVRKNKPKCFSNIF